MRSRSGLGGVEDGFDSSSQLQPDPLSLFVVTRSQLSQNVLQGVIGYSERMPEDGASDEFSIHVGPQPLWENGLFALPVTGRDPAGEICGSLPSDIVGIAKLACSPSGGSSVVRFGGGTGVGVERGYTARS